jgi:hypothetical protein
VTDFIALQGGMGGLKLKDEPGLIYSFFGFDEISEEGLETLKQYGSLVEVHDEGGSIKVVPKGGWGEWVDERWSEHEWIEHHANKLAEHQNAQQRVDGDGDDDVESLYGGQAAGGTATAADHLPEASNEFIKQIFDPWWATFSQGKSFPKKASV